MSIDRELALFSKFKTAPKELQKLADEHAKNWERFDKSRQQIDLWQKERMDAEKAYFDSSKVLRKALAEWRPEKTDTEIQELKK